MDIQLLTNHKKNLRNTYIIIPVHNRREITLTCIEQLQKNGDLDQYSIVVVDDGSTDGTAEAIQSLFPTVQILYGDGNLWWTGAIRKGMEYAYQQGAEYFIWLNDDCLPGQHTLNLLVEFSANHPNTITASACYLAGANIPFDTGCIGRKACTALPESIKSVDSLSGYCVCLPRIVCDVVEYPNAESLPHYGGDDAYILQATRAGLKAVILGDAKVTLRDIATPAKNFTQYIKRIQGKSLTLQLVFFTKKSKYYLSGRFFHLKLKYGIVKGCLIFTAKLLAWIFQYYLFLIKRFMNSYFKTNLTSF
ncbi:glycosyltransferase family 2 protein [[Limnothrix rosea] IAM M-220]|uniref:glycosyltransferase family 2 protein n=1 Tax=[Limnothrix rosea] IAM M-220 TaxID=454133 RepID=UPI001C0BED9A|nr:glycosyltransferase family 2 protein [[Limnothrix rosea] IAM M-220]